MHRNHTVYRCGLPAALFALILFSAADVGAQPASAPSEDYSGVVAQARALVEEHVRAQGLPGLAVAVSVGGETVWAEGFGYADVEHRVPVWPSTKFRIGSISKPFTAVAVAQLVEQGRLDLDAPVQQYVPDFPEKRWTVTTRQLGGHLGGVRHYRGLEMLSSRRYRTVAQGLEIFSADTLLHEPGSAYSYSSYGWNLISAVVEGASGQPFLDYMHAHVFRPLGLVHTTADYTDSLITQRIRPYDKAADGTLLNSTYVDNSYKWAGGGFLSSVEDLLRFGRAVVLGDFLSEEGRRALFTEQQTTAGEGIDYGFGWRVAEDRKGRRMIGHSGGSVGGTSQFIVQPETGVIVAMTTNLSRGNLGVFGEVYTLFVDAASKE